MYTSEKTDSYLASYRHNGSSKILGRTQAKLMNYISYPEIHAPLGQGQSPVSTDSLKSTDYVHCLETTNNSLQTTKTAVWTVSRLHTQPSRLPKKSTALQPEQNQAQNRNLSLQKYLGARVQSL